MTKSSFEKAAASRIVSWKFSVISENSSIRGQLYLKVAAKEFLVLSTLQHERYLESSYVTSQLKIL